MADSSPLIVLLNIGHIQILPALFREVVIRPQIAAEFADSKRPQTVQDFIRERPVWLRVQAPASVESMPELHEGERAAICLASELHADLLLIDESDGRGIKGGLNSRHPRTSSQYATRRCFPLPEPPRSLTSPPDVGKPRAQRACFFPQQFTVR